MNRRNSIPNNRQPGNIIRQIMSFLRRRNKGPARFANRPDWLQDELTEKALEKRSSRAAKRLQDAQHGGIQLMDRPAAKQKKAKRV
jgi:hypothetical protein